MCNPLTHTDTYHWIFCSEVLERRCKAWDWKELLYFYALDSPRCSLLCVCVSDRRRMDLAGLITTCARLHAECVTAARGQQGVAPPRPPHSNQITWRLQPRYVPHILPLPALRQGGIQMTRLSALITVHCVSIHTTNITQNEMVTVRTNVNSSKHT